MKLFHNTHFFLIGFGMGAYFDTLLKLTYAFLFIFLITIPNMGIYASGTGIVDEDYGFIT